MKTTEPSGATLLSRHKLFISSLRHLQLQAGYLAHQSNSIIVAIEWCRDRFVQPLQTSKGITRRLARYYCYPLLWVGVQEFVNQDFSSRKL